MNSTYPKPRRMTRLFGHDGRIVIVAMDQPAYFGAMPGADQPGPLIRSLVAGGADAIVTTFGVAMACAADFGRAGLILRADGGSTKLAPNALPGSVESFRYVLDGCYVPVAILDGPKMGSDQDLLTTVREALTAGASGVALGRNVWQHPRPERITAAVAALVHLDATVEQAMGMLT